jgi:Tannase and feruloyl esterase
MTVQRKTRWVKFILAASALLPGLANALDIPAVASTMACSDLTKLQYPNATGIDTTLLPEAPFRIESATVVEQNVARPYCDVVGYVPPRVRFQVKMPIKGWTQRILVNGCGAFCGTLTQFLNFGRTTVGNQHVAKGELVLVYSDNGHGRAGTLPDNGADGFWALRNPDGIIEAAYEGQHKAVVAAKALVKMFYGQPQKRSYFMGCSEGGRNALQEVQRYPEEFDGVVAGAPVIDMVANNSQWHGWFLRSNLAANGMSILTSDKLPILNRAVLSARGRQNGGVGDMLNDFRSCNFDPHSLVCPDPATCLSAAQADAASKIYQGPVDEQGRKLSAGGMPRGSELAWAGSMVTAPGVPLIYANSSDYRFSTDLPNYMASFAPTGITVQNMSFTIKEYRDLNHLRGIWDPNNPDLGVFAAKGGKLIVWQGTADSGIAPYSRFNYYDAVGRAIGPAARDNAMVMYSPPGVYHCNGGPVVAASDYLTALIQWVEDGVRPGKINYAYRAGPADSDPIVKTRPVFPYPAVAHYGGNGDVNDAASYVAGAYADRPRDRYEWVGLPYEPGNQKKCSLVLRPNRAVYQCGGVRDDVDR